VKPWKFAVLLGVGCPGPVAFAQLKAFPEAEGFGRFATGGRTNLASATVYHVTNLNDTGAGSFRDAVSQSNRFIVFDVGGIARINSVITFASNITIAGQTAPGGFQVYGNRVAFHGANNLVSRYWGARNAATNNNDAASLARGTNMIWDHMSITWGRDGTFDINPDSGEIIDNITIQNTVIAQGLQASNHSTGGLMTLSEDRNFSVIKSLFADNKTRNPKARGNNEYLNNVVYGWTEDAYIMGDTVNAIGRANAEGNYFIRGPLNSSHPFSNGTAQFQIYGNGNLYDSNQNGVPDGVAVTSYPGATVMATRHNFPTTSVMIAPNALAFVLDNVGPSITRDVVDTNLVNEVKSYGTLGGLIDRETDIYPNYDTDPQYVRPRARLVDTDGDGMPDNWETSRGYNPGNGTDWKTLAPSGYSRLEDYLNELGGYVNTKSATAGGAWTTPATWGGTVPNFSTTAVAIGGVTHASGNAFARHLTLDGASTVSGGTLDVFDTLMVGSGGNGTLTISGGTVSAGQVVLGAPGRSGSLALNGGTLQVGPVVSGGGAAAFTINGGTVKATNATLNIAVPTTVGAAGGTINTNGFNGAIAGLLGSGALTKTGGGTLTLGGNNSAYVGGINLNFGAITLATSSGNSSTGTITAANGTQINVTTSGASTPLALANAATVTLSAGGLTYNGAVTGAAGTTLLVSNSSSGTSNFTIGGNLASFAGTLDLAGSTGNVRIGGAGSALANFDAGDSTGTLRTSNDGTTNFGSLSGGANTRLQGSTNGTTASTYVIGANGNSTTFAGTISNGTSATPGVLHLTKTGAGTLTLSGTASTHTGVTTLNGGTLTVASITNGGAASSIGQSAADAANLVFNGGTLRYTGITAQNTNRLFTLGTGASAGRIDSSSANNSAMTFNNTGAVAFTGTGARTLTLAGVSTGNNVLALALADGTAAAAGATSVVKSGNSTWSLTGTATYTGGTTVQAGLLKVSRLHENNPVNITGGTLQVLESTPGLSSGVPSGNNASVSRPSSLSIAPGATLDLTNNDLILDYTGASPAAAIEALVASGYNVTGNWLGDGITSSTAAADGSYTLTVADNAALAAPFGSAQGGGLFAGVDVDLTTVLVKFTHRADLDLDGMITPNDASIFGTNYSQSDFANRAMGDMDYDGVFTPNDASIFGTFYDESVASLPEPVSLGLICLLGVGLSRRRRRAPRRFAFGHGTRK
jgi:autotransporter-associated beta strand protein